jgi:hypothetical protein
MGGVPAGCCEHQDGPEPDQEFDMAKSTTKKHGPDAALLAMIRRHDHSWARWGRFAERNEIDPRIDALSDECCELEPIIIATPAHTKEGLAGKRRIIDTVGYVALKGRPATGDLARLVKAWTSTQRVGAAG